MVQSKQPEAECIQDSGDDRGLKNALPHLTIQDNTVATVDKLWLMVHGISQGLKWESHIFNHST